MRQNGVALVLVLWLLAGLTLLAASLAASSRVGVRTAAIARDLIVAEALGDGAINLAMAEMATSSTKVGSAVERALLIDGRNVSVSMVPLNGFVNINAAPAPLLEALLTIAGQLDADAARTIAQRIIDWRDPDAVPLPQGAEDPAYVAAGVPFRTRGARFESIDDLMQVLGMSFELFDKIRPLVVAGGSSSRVNPMLAPLPVLVVLARGNVQTANRIFVARQAKEGLPEISDLDQSFVEMAQQAIFRVVATVDLGHGRRVARAREIRRSTAMRGLPWESIRIEAPRVVTGS